MAQATCPGVRTPGAAKVGILRAGYDLVSSATQDMGGGTYTTMTQVVSDVTGIPMDRIQPELGDSQFPPAPVSGGSMTPPSALPAVPLGAIEPLKKIVQTANPDEESPFQREREEDGAAAER